MESKKTKTTSKETSFKTHTFGNERQSVKSCRRQNNTKARDKVRRWS